MTEFIGKFLDEVDEVGVVGDETSETVKLVLLFVSDGVLKSLGGLVSFLCREERSERSDCSFPCTFHLLHTLLLLHFWRLFYIRGL